MVLLDKIELSNYVFLSKRLSAKIRKTKLLFLTTRKINTYDCYIITFQNTRF